MLRLPSLATLDAWKNTPDAHRHDALGALASALGPAFRPGRARVGAHGLGELVHDDGQRFVVVPGGWLRMGFSVDDVFVAAAARGQGGRASPWGGSVAGARPTRWVRIRPFLLGAAGIPPEAESGATDGGRAGDAYRAAVADARGDAPPEASDAEADPPMRRIAAEEASALVPEGFRLPSEAELEWAFREAGTTRWIGVPGEVAVTAQNRWKLLGELRSGFGLLGIRDAQNVTGDGAADYDAASPTDQRARATETTPHMARWAHTHWQDDDAEMIAIHAAYRAVPDQYGDTILRLAADLPLAPEELPPPGELAEHARTLAALASDDPRTRDDALLALDALVNGPGDDAAPTALAVLRALPHVAAGVRAVLLVWLADVQIGGHFHHTVAPPERLRRESLRKDRAAVRDAVAGAVSQVAACLEDADAGVRSAAALALSFAVDAADAARPALVARLGAEEVAGVRAALVLALGRLGGAEAELRAAGDDAVIAGARAVATAFDGEPDVDALVAATALERVEHLALAGGQLGDVAIGLLDKLGDDVRRRAAPVIAARAGRLGDGGIGAFALQMVFGAPPQSPVPDAVSATGRISARAPGEPVAAEALSDAERAVVRALVDLDDGIPWHAHGLPPSVAGRRRLVGLAPPGPSDANVAYAGAAGPVGYALRHLQWREAGGDERAAEERAALVASLSPVERLMVYLDRFVHGLHVSVRGVTRGVPALPADWKLESLLDAAWAADRAATRGAVDAFVAMPDRWRGGPELVRTVRATRDAGEALDARLLDEIGDDALGQVGDLLGAFPRDAIERRLESALAPLLEAALRSDGWQIGVDWKVQALAPLLRIAPSPTAARSMLVLGWASGQPAAVREAVGKHAEGAALAAVLAEYDALPQFKGWPAAREGTRALLGDARVAQGSSNSRNG